MTQNPDPVSTPPIPVPDEVSADFWRYASEGTLTTQQCQACGWRAYPPRIVCPNCRADPPRFDWTPVSGDGTLATWARVEMAMLPGFGDEVPYVVAEVELPEQAGLRLVTRLRGVADDELRIGLPLRVAFVPGGDDTRVPVFEQVAS